MKKPLRLNSQWLKNRSPEEVESIKHTLETNRAFVDQFLEILKELSDTEENAMKSLKDYDSPAWPYLRSNRDGALRAYRSIKKLFEPTET
jgi:hypothetical protein